MQGNLKYVCAFLVSYSIAWSGCEIKHVTYFFFFLVNFMNDPDQKFESVLC